MLDDHHRVSGRDELPERGEEGRHVVEMQPGGGLVEEEQGTAASAFPRPDATGHANPAERPREVPRELESLRLAAAQGRHRLAEGDIAEPHRGKGRELLPDVGRVGEARDGLIDGEVEHVGDGKTVRGDLHFQDIRPEAPPVAVRTAQVHVAQELHLEVLEAIPRAGGTASVRVVEAEPPGGIAPFPGERLGREELADRVEGADVARRDRATGLADRGLIHEHHVRNRLHPVNPVVAPRGLPRAAETLEDPAVAHLLHQGRFPRAAHPGHAHEAPERDPDVDPLQVVLRRAADQEMAGVAEMTEVASLRRGSAGGAAVIGSLLRRPSRCRFRYHAPPAARRALGRRCLGNDLGAFHGSCDRLGLIATGHETRGLR